jgi:hypothetical protein
MWCGRGVVPKPMRIQREGAQLQIRGTWSAGPGDDQARFLADLRALRDYAAIGYDELAARAHYPSDVLKEAENGPSLPGLPILSAYVRACEGDVLDWEERWRQLNPDVADDPELPVRPAGASAAAVAGARAGVGVAPPDVYDPERIKAALRGNHARSAQAGRRTIDPGVLAPASAAAGTGLESPDPGMPADSAVGAGWDPAPDSGITGANGNHTTSAGPRGPFDAALTNIPDAAEAAATEQFSWLQKSKPEAGAAGGDVTWPQQAGNGRPAEAADSGYGWSGQAESPQPADPDVTQRILRHQAEGLAAQERTDFWGQPLPSAQADLRLPATAPRAEEPAIPRASWPSAADTTSAGAEPAHQSTAPAATPPISTAQPPGTARSFGSAKALGSAGSPTQAAAGGRDRRQDRYFPARLLAVIVIAALIGSALVLLLK